MSVITSQNVSQTIKKYRDKYPGIERPLLCTLIRLEYENQTLKSKNFDSRDEVSFLKQLERMLAKAYQTSTSKPTEQPQTKIDDEHIEESETDKAKAELIKKGMKALGL